MVRTRMYITGISAIQERYISCSFKNTGVKLCALSLNAGTTTVRQVNKSRITRCSYVQ